MKQQNQLNKLYTQDQVIELLNQLQLNTSQITQCQQWLETQPAKTYFNDESLIAIGNNTRKEFVLLLKKLLDSDQLSQILQIDEHQVRVYKSELTYLLHRYLVAQIESETR